MTTPRETSSNPIDPEVQKVYVDKIRSIESYSPEMQQLIRIRYSTAPIVFETDKKPPEKLIRETLELIG